MKLADKIRNANPSPGHIALFWLGQAGFVIKNSQGRTLALDVYLSDLSERLDGNKRLTPAPIEPAELEAGILLASHLHTDHLDLDSLPSLLSHAENLYCCAQSYELCREQNLPMEKITAMKEGDRVEKEGFVIEAVFCDHGDSAPAALGFVVETEGVRLYFPGDTGYQGKRMRPATEREIDILVVPINGEYGNMNERDAAMLAAQTKARLTIPSHFWTFARHRGNPYDFELEMRANAPDCPYLVMAQGEMLGYPL